MTYKLLAQNGKLVILHIKKPKIQHPDYKDDFVSLNIKFDQKIN